MTTIFSPPSPSSLIITASSSNNSNDPSQIQHYFLKWNDYTNNLTTVIDNLLETEAFVDVTLSIEAGKSLKCHKVVLSACSAYFQNLFIDNPCQHPIVIMRDIGWRELRFVVEYMYRGEINVTEEQLGPVLKAAELLKIRGLIDVNKSVAASSPTTLTPSPKLLPNTNTKLITGESTTSNNEISRNKTENEIEKSKSPYSSSFEEAEDLTRKRRRQNSSSPSPISSQQQQDRVRSRQRSSGSLEMSSTDPMSLSPIVPRSFCKSLSNNIDDACDVKPGILEMIQEEQRAKIMEASQMTQNWMAAAAAANAAASSSGQQPQANGSCYQYQLQQMWQKYWNQNSSLMQAGIRYRERGPMKSWRPETMAGAIWAVLQEGLSLSQAARKYDIPYPTFVLYANRVHNMLGPSVNGSSPTIGELRPKGRGRPQRILLGNWPENHVRQVIRAVVFRDGTIPSYNYNNNNNNNSNHHHIHSSGHLVEDGDRSPLPSSSLRPPSSEAPLRLTPGASNSDPLILAAAQLKQMVHYASLNGGSGLTPGALAAAANAMGGPLTELIMKEMEFDPLTLSALVKMNGGGSPFEDAEEDMMENDEDDRHYVKSENYDDDEEEDEEDDEEDDEHQNELSSSEQLFPKYKKNRENGGVLSLNPEVILTEVSGGVRNGTEWTSRLGCSLLSPSSESGEPFGNKARNVVL